MSHHFFRQVRSIGIGIVIAAWMLLPCAVMGGQQQDRLPSQPQQQDTAQQDKQDTAQQENRQVGQQTSGSPDQHAADHSPELGVIAGSCPGQAVCVHDVVWGSPADEAGIEPGDYILSVDGQQVTTPVAFKRMLQSKDPARKVNLKVWRQGQQMDMAVPLAARSDKLPDSHQAWLGVMLAPAENQEQGVVIQQVIPGSPADNSGLRGGETIVQMNGQQVSNVESFVENVQDYGPDTKLNLVLRQSGNERTVEVTLGAIRNAPMRFLREVYSDVTDVVDEFPVQFSGQEASPGSLELIDQTLDQMRQQIRTLEEQIRELRGEKEAGQEDESGNSDPNSGQKTGDSGDDQSVSGDLPALPATLAIAPVSMLAVQQQGQRNNGNWNRNWNRDWNRGFHNRNRYGNYYSGYGYPYGGYSYPYGQSYYRYGGRPYYYGNSGNYGNSGWYGYGPRSGIRLGNFGIYWY